MDGDLGIVIEPESLPEDLHPFCLVDDQEEGVKGSCMEYKTRCKRKNTELIIDNNPGPAWRRRTGGAWRRLKACKAAW